MKRLMSLLAAVLLLVGGATAASAGQETCPNTSFDATTGGWVKHDNLSGTSFDIPEKDGFVVTDVCYKASTTVVYPGTADPVVSTVLNKPAGEPGSNVQALSHVSVYYEPVQPAPVEVDVTAPVLTAPTCEAPGSLDYEDTADYTWQVTGPDSAKVLTAVATSAEVTLVGQTEFGPYDLTQLTGEECFAPVPVEVELPAAPVPTAPTCTAPGSLTLVDTETYTWGAPLVRGPGTHLVTATARDGAVFTNGEATATFTVTVLPQIPVQSADADAACYAAPVVVSNPTTPQAPQVVTPTVTGPTTARTLAATGVDGVQWAALLAAGLVSLGGLALAVGRARPTLGRHSA